MRSTPGNRNVRWWQTIIADWSNSQGNSLSGEQVIAVRIETSLSDPDDDIYYMHQDHLGSTSILSDDDGFAEGGYIQHYPFGDYRTAPTTDHIDRGFTGHRGNTGIGLIYINARFNVPSIGQFASADTLVPDPGNPQSLNRYSYSYNNPVKYVDPSGHCTGDPDGVGNIQEQNDCWRMVRTIDNMWSEYWAGRFVDQETLWYLAGVEGLDAEYWAQEVLLYDSSDFYQDLQQHQPMREELPPVDFGDYTVFTATGLPLGVLFGGAKLIYDDDGNLYVNAHIGTAPTLSLERGDIYIDEGDMLSGGLSPIDSLTVEEQEVVIVDALSGWSVTPLSAGYKGLDGSISYVPTTDYLFTEAGIMILPGVAAEAGYTWRLLP